jgi:hypothetical protein
MLKAVEAEFIGAPQLRRFRRFLAQTLYLPCAWTVLEREMIHLL